MSCWCQRPAQGGLANQAATPCWYQGPAHGGRVTAGLMPSLPMCVDYSTLDTSSGRSQPAPAATPPSRPAAQASATVAASQTARAILLRR